MFPNLNQKGRGRLAGRLKGGLGDRRFAMGRRRHSAALASGPNVNQEPICIPSPPAKAVMQRPSSAAKEPTFKRPAAAQQVGAHCDEHELEAKALSKKPREDHGDKLDAAFDEFWRATDQVSERLPVEGEELKAQEESKADGEERKDEPKSKSMEVSEKTVPATDEAETAIVRQRRSLATASASSAAAAAPRSPSTPSSSPSSSASAAPSTPSSSPSSSASAATPFVHRRPWTDEAPSSSSSPNSAPRPVADGDQLGPQWTDSFL